MSCNCNTVISDVIANNGCVFQFLVRLVYKEVRLWRLVGCSGDLDDDGQLDVSVVDKNGTATPVIQETYTPIDGHVQDRYSNAL